MIQNEGNSSSISVAIQESVYVKTISLKKVYLEDREVDHSKEFGFKTKEGGGVERENPK